MSKDNHVEDREPSVWVLNEDENLREEDGDLQWEKSIGAAAISELRKNRPTAHVMIELKLALRKSKERLEKEQREAASLER